MAIKKSELYSSLWKSCDELRGGMDASQYKDYVLVLLFVKYVSDKYAGQKDALLDVPKGGGFADMAALKGDKEIGDKMNKIISRLAEANDLKGVIDVADFNDPDKLGKGQEMVARLTNLVSIFDNPALDFRGNRAEGDDLLGDAYEYLMRFFATQSGKSKGQFYTPAEVSRMMAKVIGAGSAKRSDQTVYDPTCGSGSLLLKAHDEARGRTGLDLAIYGQEMDNATSALARMNMILHDCPSAEIWKDNTLSLPHFKQPDGSLKTFDFVVANPPFSFKAWSNGFNPAEDEFNRFAYGIPPAKNGDYAFLLHILTSLKSNGKGAVNLPHGVLFRGNVEAEIRRNIIRRGYIKGIIGLPANLFFGTGIPACVIVLDKENAAARKGIFMIDASKGFIKDGNKNRLRAQDLHKIVDAFTRQAEIPKYSRLVPVAEIAANDYNLNLPRYIDSTEPEDLQDIDAHLRGGIPNHDIDDLARYWQVLPTVRYALFDRADRPGYSQLKVPIGEVKAAIFHHTEFTAFHQSVIDLMAKWEQSNKPLLKSIKVGGKPKALIEKLSEDLLETFKKAPLLDPYDVYQHLMDYWAETMQDDVYMIVSDGWKAVTDGKPNTDLIPQSLIIRRYFGAEQRAIEKLEADRDAIFREMEELEEEHGGEEGLLFEAKTEKGSLTRASVYARLKAIKDEEVPRASRPCSGMAKMAMAQSLDSRHRGNDRATGANAIPNDPNEDERKVLNEYSALIEKGVVATRQIKDAQKALDANVAAKYAKLTEDEIKMLVVDYKWLTTLETAVQTELDRVSQALTGRIRQLAERYATPLPKLTEELRCLGARVDEHLKKMGAAWN
jgi:type I restriction enzyme M protein